MRKKQLRALAVFVIGFFGFGMSYAQESVNSSGGDASSTTGSVAYSIGQVVYTTHSGSSGVVNQGVQQPYEIYSLDLEQSEFEFSLIVFPNPTADNLTLKIGAYNNELLMYRLVDIQGRLLSSAQIGGQQTQISMSSLPPAVYFIYILNQENKNIQSFKIIKN
jgi:hypothetical protein